MDGVNVLLMSLVAALVLAVIMGLLFSFSGDGGLKRTTTLSGIYAVCKPRGYPVVCFSEKGSEGAFHCLPLEMVGGKCL